MPMRTNHTLFASSGHPARPWTPCPELQYGDVGHVCPRTNRVAISWRDYFKLDVSGYYYRSSHADLGLDPWRVVEGADPYTDGVGVDVWLANGSCLHFPGGQVAIYVAAKDAP